MPPLSMHMFKTAIRAWSSSFAVNDLADDVGVASSSHGGDAAPRRLCTRGRGGCTPGHDGRGGKWTAPSTGQPCRPGVFDAAENTVDWSIEATDAATTAVVGVELSGRGSPMASLYDYGPDPFGGEAYWTTTGGRCSRSSTLSGSPITESAAWNHDWRTTGSRGSEPTRGSRRRHVSVSATSRDRGWPRRPTMRSWPRSSPPNPTTESSPSGLRIESRICASRSAAARCRASYCSSTVRPSGVSASNSAAPIDVPYRVSIFSRTDSKVGTPLAV